jgi:hypothetical protein
MKAIGSPITGVFLLPPFVHSGAGGVTLSGVFESPLGWWAVVGWGKRSEGVPAGLSKVNDDNFVYACVSKSFGSSLQPGCLGTNDPYQFIKNRQLALPGRN